MTPKFSGLKNKHFYYLWLLWIRTLGRACMGWYCLRDSMITDNYWSIWRLARNFVLHRVLKFLYGAFQPGLVWSFLQYGGLRTIEFLIVQGSRGKCFGKETRILFTFFWPSLWQTYSVTSFWLKCSYNFAQNQAKMSWSPLLTRRVSSSHY